MKGKVSKLKGQKLDAAVAKADGVLVTVADEHPSQPGHYAETRAEWDDYIVRWFGSRGEEGGWEALRNRGSPSTNWADGGPIIEREKLMVEPLLESGVWHGEWRAVGLSWEGRLYADCRGPTPLIAAMRAYVTSKLGDEVDLESPPNLLRNGKRP